MRSSLWIHRRAIAAMVITLIGGVLLSLALADDESDRRGLLSDIDSRLSSAASEFSGVRSDSDDGDIRDADSVVVEMRL